MLARGTKQVGAGKLELDQTQIELDPVPHAEPVLTSSLQQWMDAADAGSTHARAIISPYVMHCKCLTAQSCTIAEPMSCVFLAVMPGCAIVGMSWLVPISIFSLNKCKLPTPVVADWQQV